MSDVIEVRNKTSHNADLSGVSVTDPLGKTQPLPPGTMLHSGDTAMIDKDGGVTMTGAPIKLKGGDPASLTNLALMARCSNAAYFLTDDRDTEIYCKGLEFAKAHFFSAPGRGMLSGGAHMLSGVGQGILGTITGFDPSKLGDSTDAVVKYLSKGGQGFIAGNSDDIVIAFRGTEVTSLKDLMSDIVGTQLFADSTFKDTPVQYHTGFLAAFETLWSGDIDTGEKIDIDTDTGEKINNGEAAAKKNDARFSVGENGRYLLPLLNRYLSDFPKAKIWITGHSLGGAMALVACAHLLDRGHPVGTGDSQSGDVPPVDDQSSDNQPDDSQSKAAQSGPPKNPIAGVYTFGQPCVGDEAFAKKLNEVFDANSTTKRYIRVHNNNDCVPRLLEHADKLSGLAGTLSLSVLDQASYQHAGSLWYFDSEKEMHKDPDWSLWKSVDDRFWGAVGDFGNLGPDFLTDHSMLAYLDLVELEQELRKAEQTPQEKDDPQSQESSAKSDPAAAT